jgi:hypothetical protein
VRLNAGRKSGLGFVVVDENLKLVEYADTPQQAWNIIARFHGLKLSEEYAAK